VFGARKPRDRRHRRDIFHAFGARRVGRCRHIASNTMLAAAYAEVPATLTPRIHGTRMSSSPTPSTPPVDFTQDRLGDAAAARHPVSFTGSGSEYFRIWIVNLLLTFVTLGIYFPWAKVRKLRYFYGNTLVAGHALDFHGEPKKMLRGYAIVSALFVAYSLAGQFSPAAGLIALLLLAAIWPALLYAGLRFRLSQTSWRGLRFGFHGTLGGAYKAFLPLLLPLVILPLFLLVEQGPRGEPSGAGLVVVLGLVLAIFGVFPLMSWSLRRYQHAGFGLGDVHAAFTAGPGPFFAIFLKTTLLTLATGSVFGIVAVMAAGLSALVSLLTDNRDEGVGAWVAIVLAIVASLAYAAVMWVSQPYFASRIQNLAWNRTESAAIGFDSQLRFRPLLWLSVKNWLLIIVTLGLYWPFAAIATAKMKLESVELLARRDLDTFVRGEGETSKDAAGDAAGDVFGIDIGM
jgi:uncharacterized membrane protein YjgN (DUF898 family)